MVLGDELAHVVRRTSIEELIEDFDVDRNAVVKPSPKLKRNVLIKAPAN